MRREFYRLITTPMQSLDTGQNYFELFGLPANFDVDPQNLHATQRRLQAECHPDRFVNAGDRERRISVQLTSWINQAYETLRDPVKRARYLLEVSGATLPDESSTTADTVFLMEQIELREALDACRQAEDGLERSDAIAARLEQRAAELAEEFVARFDAGDHDGAAGSSQKMQFIQRIRQQLDELQFELESR